LELQTNKKGIWLSAFLAKALLAALCVLLRACQTKRLCALLRFARRNSQYAWHVFCHCLPPKPEFLPGMKNGRGDWHFYS
jgi:hypothetical protein